MTKDNDINFKQANQRVINELPQKYGITLEEIAGAYALPQKYGMTMEDLTTIFVKNAVFLLASKDERVLEFSDQYFSNAKDIGKWTSVLQSIFDEVKFLPKNAAAFEWQMYKDAEKMRIDFNNKLEQKLKISNYLTIDSMNGQFFNLIKMTRYDKLDSKYQELLEKQSELLGLGLRNEVLKKIVSPFLDNAGDLEFKYILDNKLDKYDKTIEEKWNIGNKTDKRPDLFGKFMANSEKLYLRANLMYDYLDPIQKQADRFRLKGTAKNMNELTVNKRYFGGRFLEWVEIIGLAIGVLFTLSLSKKLNDRLDVAYKTAMLDKDRFGKLSSVTFGVRNLKKDVDGIMNFDVMTRSPEILNILNGQKFEENFKKINNDFKEVINQIGKNYNASPELESNETSKRKTNFVEKILNEKTEEKYQSRGV